FEQGRATSGQATKEYTEGNRRTFLQQGGIVHAGEPGELSFKMTHCAQIGFVAIQKTKGALQQVKEFGGRVFWLSANLDQFNEVRSRLSPQITLSNPDIGIA